MVMLKLLFIFLISVVMIISLYLDKLDQSKIITLVPMGPIHQKLLIVARWKSGSTYFGELLAQYPETYYTYEPLHVLQNKDNKWASMDVLDIHKVLESTFECNFTDTSLHELSQRNIGYGEYMKECQYPDNRKCQRPTFHEEKCLKSSLRMMKTVRLRMKQIEFLLEKYSSLKVILLMRDPRSILSSRLPHWCGRKPNCSDVDILCQEMDQDLIYAQKYTQMYPKRIQIIKYEDMNEDPFTETLHLLDNFLNLPIIDDFKVTLAYYLKSHSNIKVENVSIPVEMFWQRRYSNAQTKRSKRKMERRHWSKVFNASFIFDIQHKCYNVLEKLDYLNPYLSMK